MLLPPEEAAKFHSLYHSLIGFVSAKVGGVDGIVDIETFRKAPVQRKGQARDLLYKNIDLIGAYVEENPGDFRELDLGLVLGWKRFLRGRFVIERDLREYTVFMTEGDPPRAYGVLGLNSEIAEIIPQPLPTMVDAVLLPWKDRSVCDGLLSSYNVMFGPGLRRSMKESYIQWASSGGHPVGVRLPHLTYSFECSATVSWQSVHQTVCQNDRFGPSTQVLPCTNDCR